jgi:hypothetical protein
MSNAKPAMSGKGSKKGTKGEAPEPPVLDASATPELARAFSNAWTVDITRASPETMPKRAQAVGAALKPESVSSVLDALAAYVPVLDDVDAVMTRDSKTPRERDARKTWQSRLAGVGILSHAVRFPHVQSDEVDARLAALLSSSASEMVREEIVKALLGDATLGTKPGAMKALAAYVDDAACTDLALLRAGFRSLYTMDPKKAHERWRKALKAPDVTNPRAVWLAKIAFEQMEAHKADVDDLAGDVFPLIKLPKGRGADLQAAAFRYAGLTSEHYLALIKYVAEKDDDPVLVDAIAERFYWASLGANGVKQEDVRPKFKELERRYLDKADASRAAVFTKLLAGLAREGKA